MGDDQLRDSALRFAFGKNWSAYLERVNARTIAQAEQSLRNILQADDLAGRRFLDAGSGSGLFSLAALRLGATVHSFDFDADSVECAKVLKAAYAPDDDRWTIERGSLLDTAYLGSIGKFDVVYSWGVLHHTGDMWTALRNVMELVKPGGKLCVAIYNDQGLPSRVWAVVKRTYNRLPARWRFVVLWPAFVRLWGPTFIKDLLRGAPRRTWTKYAEERGMSPLIDVRDWVGGYPFEVATPAAVTSFCSSRRYALVRLVPRTGIGCSEFVFEKRC